MKLTDPKYFKLLMEWHNPYEIQTYGRVWYDAGYYKTMAERAQEAFGCSIEGAVLTFHIEEEYTSFLQWAETKLLT